MARAASAIVVLADPDLTSSVGSTRGLSLGNAASNSNNLLGCCGLHAFLVVVDVECGLRFPPYRHKVRPAADSQQPDRSVEKNRIRLSVVNQSAVALDGQMPRKAAVDSTFINYHAIDIDLASLCMLCFYCKYYLA